MIFHTSIQVDDPERVAKALAEWMGGKAMPFHTLVDNAWYALAGDDHATGIEVFPRGFVMVLDKDEPVVTAQIREPVRETATHIALTSPLSVDEIKAVAERNGWFVRDSAKELPFRFVDVWVEGCLNVEVFCPEHHREFLEFFTIEKYEAAVPYMKAAWDKKKAGDAKVPEAA